MLFRRVHMCRNSVICPGQMSPTNPCWYNLGHDKKLIPDAEVSALRQQTGDPEFQAVEEKCSQSAYSQRWQRNWITGIDQGTWWPGAGPRVRTLHAKAPSTHPRDKDIALSPILLFISWARHLTSLCHQSLT